MSASRIAIYPGSFDPITLGHVDIIERAAGLFDKIVVAIATNESKKFLLSPDDRQTLATESLSHLSNVSVERVTGLTVDLAIALEASVIIRGLRDASDFDYENRIAIANRKLAPSLETIFLVPANDSRFISSTIVREILKVGGSIDAFVPDAVSRMLSRSVR